ncbi:DUF2637 domain-containing protein [Kitasatospora sp. NPDC056181]|uniref:DUF2637 domain-containing protein n=1 Tax=Kitasatospora sp. NPDC056181 TaxID=3345737 RepID=UPI0035DF8C7E
MATSHPIAVPDRSGAVLGLTIGAALVTIALTAVAFWLSYEALHDLATGHHLAGARAWAWPATLDSFIVVGELLVLRASLLRRLDLLAMVLVAVGSAGSIILNVVSVGAGVDATTQVVAAVPPVAALLAYTALMRQIYRALTAAEQPAGPRPGARETAAPAPVAAPLTAVTAPALPPMPAAPPALPPAYADQRCAVIRPLYADGYRPGTTTMRTALTTAGYLGPDGRPLSDALIRGTLRAEVERLEPVLATYPAEQALRAAA